MTRLELSVLAIAGAGATLAGFLLAGTASGGDDGLDLVLARRAERRVEDAIARVRDAVVTIGAEQQEPADSGAPKQVTSGGSGVIVSPDGFILTNDHVTIGADRVRVGLRDGRTLGGRVTGRDRMGDIAVVKIEGKDFPHAALGSSDRLHEGDAVLALGNPFGLANEDHDPAATLGIVSGLHRYQGGEKVYGDAIQIDAAVNPGNSGGPLFDLDGNVVGLTGRISIRATEKKNVGVGFAVPIDQVRLILPQLEMGEDVVHGYLGVRFRGEVEGDGRAGVEVAEVRPGTPADRAGLHAGDRIVTVNGKPVDQPVRLENILSVLPAGSEVSIGFERGGRPFETKVILIRRPGS
jgi:S1-C subfamily serine protease